MEYFDAEPWLDERDSLGESPRYDARTESVSWIDIDSGLRRVAKLGGTTSQSEDFGAPLGAHEIGVERDAVAVGGQWWDVDRDTGERRCIASLEESGMRFNDSAIDSRGRLWSATMREDEAMDGTPRGSLRLLSEGSLPTLLSGLTAGNGIAWAPDNKFMYLADSGPNHVLRMPFDDGSAKIGAPDIWLEPRGGTVDGIVGDLAGGLWICLWGAGELHRYDRSGRHVAVIRVGGASQVTAACFAGDDLQTIVITTSRREAPSGEHHGAVFRTTVPIPGRPSTFWRGN